MTTAYTSLLGLALPVTGELSGTWGTVVNESITSLLDTSVAGTTNVSTDTDVTLTTTTGAANTARQAILLFSGARTALRTVTAPAQSKIYTVINATTGGFSVKLVGAGPTTGVTIVAGESAVCAWNGSDFIKISNTGGSASFVNLTASGTVTFTGLSASQAVFTNASDELVSNAITGTGNVVMSASPTLTGTISAAAITASGTATLNGAVVIFNSATNTLSLQKSGGAASILFGSNTAANGQITSVASGGLFFSTGDITQTEKMRITATGDVGIGNSSPTAKLDVTGTAAISGNVTLSGGTANGVAYLNGSKVVTSGGSLVFNGTRFSNVVTSDTNTTVARFGVINSASTDDAYLDVSVDAANNLVSFTSTGNNVGSFAFLNSGTENMRLTSTGLGIGTSSPTQKLTVAGNINLTPSDSRFLGGDATGRLIVSNSDTTTYVALYGSSHATVPNSLALIAGSGSLTLNNAGNLGLGVTPSAWTSAFKAFQFGATGSLVYNGSTDVYLSNNYASIGGSSKYITTAAATLYQQGAGVHAWYNAPSGTAGNAITFTQAMTLASSGGLSVGTTSDAGAGNINISGTYKSNGVDLIASDGSSNYLKIGATLYIQSGSTTRAVIDGSGNLLVGTTSGNARLRVLSTASQSQSAYITHPTFDQDVISCENSATSGDNKFISFYTDATVNRGNISYNRTGGLVVYNTTSDYRAKDISGPVTNSGALIDSVPVYMGKMKWATQERPMFIAHETPEYAHTGVKDAVDADGNPVYQQMDASALIPVMWAEIQSLRKRLADAGI